MGSVAKGMPGVIGREPELAMLEEFLDWGTPWLALLLTGGPGIGKTALWERGLHLARDRGVRVLAARASGAEARSRVGSDLRGLERPPAPKPGH